jgi:SAM-dependent methyltransferase
MSSDFQNVYDDDARSQAYATLEFPGTYYLVYRDLPAIIRAHTHGNRALDFGCGTGRSTRFLRGLGFESVGVDISAPMLTHARLRDSGGDYRLVPDGDLSTLAQHAFDLILAAFTFDNVPTLAKKVALFRALSGLLADDGRIITVVSSRDIYLHEWTTGARSRTFCGPTKGTLTCINVPACNPSRATDRLEDRPSPTRG